MPNSSKDIDSILESIKKRKEERGINDSPISSEKKIDVKPTTKEASTSVLTATNPALETFLNTETKKVAEKKEEVIEETLSKQDDEFKDFFTITVAVTKQPKELEVNTGKKKSSFFKKKYVTDSLSLNLPDEYFFEDENKDKKLSKKIKKEQKLNAIKEKEELLKEEVKEEIFDDSEIIEETIIQKQPKKKKKLGFKSLFSISDKDIEEMQNEEYEIAELTEELEIPAPKKEKVKKEKQKLDTSSMPIYKKYKDDEIDNKETPKEIIIKEDIKNDIDSSKTLEIDAIKTEPKKDLLSQIISPSKNGDESTLTNTQIALNSIMGADIKEDSKDNKEDIKEDIDNKILSNTAENVFSALQNQDTQDVFYTKFVETQTITDLNSSSEEDDNEKIEFNFDYEEEEEESVFEEYLAFGEIFEKATDESQDITSELQNFKTTLSFRIAAGFIGALLLSMLTIFATSSINLPSFINPVSQPMSFYLVNLVIFFVILLAFIPTIISGFKGLFKEPTPDSFISLGCVLTLIQLLVFTFNSDKLPPNEMTIFASIVCFALAFNAIGKRIATDNIIRNLKLAYAPEGINVGYILKDTEAVKRLSRTLDSNMPNILLSRKTSNITNFLQAGFSISKSDIVSKKVVLVSYVVTGVSFLLSLVLSKSITTAISCAAGSAVMQIPLAHSMIVSVPSLLMQNKLKQVGALVNGWQGIDQLSKTTHVTFDAKHLFPKSSVVLQSIRPVKVDKLDTAILYASSVLIAECENLKPIFMKVIKNNTDILYPVESCEYTQNQGYVAWVNKSRVLVGNRQLMEKYDISLPPLNGETALMEKNQKPIYISINGQLYGVFIVSYHRDDEVKRNLDVFVKHSRNIILTSRDFNVDARLVEKIYDLPLESVGVLTQQEFLLMQSYTDYTFETEACVAHLDNLHSLTQSFSASEAARIAQTICLVVQNLSVATGAVLALLFSYSLTIPKIPLLSIQLLALGWAGLTIVVAYIKKY